MNTEARKRNTRINWNNNIDRNEREIYRDKEFLSFLSSRSLEL